METLVATETHVYTPSRATGACQHPACEPPARPQQGTRARCLWCKHAKGVHNGRVDPVVLDHYTVSWREVTHWNSTLRQNETRRERVTSVAWTPTACSVAHCACRRYEK